MDLTGKVAIVTGASAGIGAATVKALLNLGMTVVGFARRKEKILELAKNERLFAVSVDLTKKQEILNGFAWVSENVGPVYVLINNAGVGTAGTVIDGDEEIWKSIIDTNLMSVMLTCREAIGIMQKNKVDGYIINVSSVVGQKIVDMPNIAIYAASKSALNALTEHLRLDLIRMNSKIKLSTVMPGLVKTDIIAASGYMNKEQSEQFYDQRPHIKSEDVADALVYLINTPPHVQITELMIRPVGEKDTLDLQKL